MADNYARGGYIPGGPVPATLVRGCEFYLTRAQVEALGPNPLLDELNRRRDDEEADRG